MAYKDLLQPDSPFNTDFSEDDYNALISQGFTDEDIYNMSSEEIDHYLSDDE